MEKPAIIKVLEDAHRAHQAGDFVNALKFYEYFFDHALEEDPLAYYGARLSYCLQGWAELAKTFPSAKNALEKKKREMHDSYFSGDRDPERFHDYLSICRCLGTESDVLEKFLNLHHSEPKSAAKLIKFLWNDLINAEHWQVCSELMEQSSLKLDELFAVFDEATKLKDSDPAFNNPRFEQHIVDTLLSDTQKVVTVLRHSGRQDEIPDLQRQFYIAATQRGHALLSKQAHAKGSFLFTGH